MRRVYKLLIVVTCSLVFLSANAQMNYTVSYPTNTYLAITGTSPYLTLAYPLDLAAAEGVSETDEGAANNIMLPFPFTFNCVKYSKCHISTNGFLAFGAPIDTFNVYWNNNLKSGPFDSINNNARFTRPILAPLWDDLDMQAATNIKYNTSGVAPNRVFTVQWSNVKWNWQAVSASVNFQVKLYETTNEIVFHYKPINAGTVTSASASVGLADCSLGAGNFLSLSKLSDSASTSSWFSYNDINSKPVANFAIKFTPTQCTQLKSSSICHRYPIVSGEIFYDNNSNGVKDATELFYSNVKVNLSNGRSAFTNKDGYFSIYADSLGSYTLTVNAPNYYTSLPQSINYNISTYDTLITNLIALQPNQANDSMRLDITPMMWRARPGFSFPYHISYQNIGTTTISPTLSFNYNDTKLNYLNATNANVINSTNNLSINIGSTAPGQSGSFIAYFKVKPTVPIGDSVVISGSLTYATNVKIVSLVGGSFDPNDKAATPVLTPIQVALGKDIDYTIRFQNTGNDTAFTVAIEDTLSSDLLVNTLVFVGSSHNCKTTVDSNIVHFEFFNIQLPDSNVNEIGSHGFVSFKIKPKSSLTNGSSVSNKASIYFDYNAPVLTNTAITQINTSGVVTPVKLTSYELIMMNERTVKNIWTTASEINTSHFNIQRSFDGINFETIGKVVAVGVSSYSFLDLIPPNYLNLNTYYYRLQAADKDGSYQFSKVKTLNIKLQPLKGLSIYPNPTKEIITIVCKDARELFIVDYLGKEVMSKKIFNNQYSTINVQGLAKGFYMVKVVTANGDIKTEKLVIE